jgi:hypothetical protein
VSASRNKDKRQERRKTHVFVVGDADETLVSDGGAHAVEPELEVLVTRSDWMKERQRSASSRGKGKTAGRTESGGGDLLSVETELDCEERRKG